MKVVNNAVAPVKLKTIQVTPEFLRNLAYLRSFYTTDAKAIRDAVKLLAMERAGEVEVVRKVK